MKIVLIYLPHPYLKQPDAQSPLGLMYLASVLERQSFQVEIKNYSSFLTYEAMQDLPEADFYGITVTSLELPQANRFAFLIKEKFPRSFVGIGGPGSISHEFVNWDVIDTVCVGEGEKTILQMMSDIKSHSLQRVYYGQRVDDLDSLPFPARHLLGRSQGGNVFAYNNNYKDGGSTIILTSRGCPFSCSFCSSPRMSGPIRHRNPESVLDEVRHVINTYGIRQFRFSDDMFTSNKLRMLKVCDLLSKEDIAWRISCRVKPFDAEMAEALHSAGCKEVSFGVESFDDGVLRTLKKMTTAEDNAEALRICDDHGIKTRVLFMIRTPGQTKRTVPINIDWLQKVPYNIIACTCFVPMPGSDIWDNPDRYGIEIIDRNLDHYNFYFFGRYGENEVRDVMAIKGRDADEVNEETTEFRRFLKSTGKVNRG